MGTSTALMAEEANGLSNLYKVKGPSGDKI